MMEGAQLVTEFLGHRHFGEELIRPIAVDLHEDLATQDVSQGFQFEIAFRRLGVLVAFLHFLVIAVPIADIFPRLLQGRALHFEVAHAS